MMPIIMPQVGQDIPSATIIEWRKKENDPVRKGEVVLVVESDKASFEVEAEESGVLLKVLYDEGEEVEILEPLAYIGQPGETVEERQSVGPAEAACAPGDVAEVPEQPGPGPAAVSARAAGASASPSARRLAKERGVDLERVSGSGPDGRIIKRDVLAAAKATVADVSAADKVVPFGKMRQRIADRLSLSQQTTPTFCLCVDADMSYALQWRGTVNRERRTEITVTDMLIKACAAALTEFERMNSQVYRDRMVLRKRVHVGVAVSVDDGILVPVVPDADGKSLVEISGLSKENARRARRGVISSTQVGTFTISTLGMHAISRFVPMINPPECAILGVGSIEKRAMPAQGGVEVRDMMTLTLVCDHRAVDGADAAQFLNRIRHYLEDIPGVWDEWLGC